MVRIGFISLFVLFASAMLAGQAYTIDKDNLIEKDYLSKFKDVNDYYNEGIEMYNAKRYYPDAYKAFIVFGDLGNKKGNLDKDKIALSYFNAGLAAYSGGAIQKSADAFVKAIENGYEQPEAWTYAIACWQTIAQNESGRFDEANDSILQIAIDGLNKFGIEETLFLNNVINSYVIKNEANQALRLLNSLISQYNDKSNLYALRGYVFDRMEMDSQSVEDYLKAASLSDVEFETLKNASKKLFRVGTSRLNAIEGNSQQENSERENIKRDYFEKSRELAEKANRKNPGDKDLQNVQESLDYVFMTFFPSNSAKDDYKGSDNVKYEQKQIQDRTDNKRFVTENSRENPKNQNVNLTTINQTADNSSVDKNIPIGNVKNPNIFALIIANEDYQDVAGVPNALNDGVVFSEYCNKTLGLPEENIHLVKNATLNNIKRELNLMSQIAEAYKGEASFIVYYAGHGIPDEYSGNSYILPVDGFTADLSTCYSLADFYNRLGQFPSQKVLVFIDACFSGAIRGNGMLQAARGVALKAKPAAPSGNMIIFSAAQGDETAFPLEKEKHGLFTYWLLKNIRDYKGEIKLGELADKIADSVGKQSLVINGKKQTPTVHSSSSLGESWKKWKINEI